MGKTFNTGYLQNIIQYDENDNVIIPSLIGTGTRLVVAGATGTLSSQAASTTNIVEGTRLYYTDARVGTYLSSNSYATQSYVTTAIANLVDSAPVTLDTLNELAAALGDDPNFATTVATSIGGKLSLTGGTLTGILNLNNATSNRINFGTNGVATPTFITYSNGVKIILYDSLGASALGYTIGIDAGTLFNTLPAADAGMFFKWYGGTTVAASLGGTGIFTAASLVKSGGTSSQFLKADGSVDSSTYLTTSSASSTYVPYTGASADLVLGANNFSSKRVSVLKSSDGYGGFTSNYLFLQTGSSTTNVGTDGISLFSKPNQRALSINYDIGGTNYAATLDANLLNASRTFEFPNASGVLALTSNIPTNNNQLTNGAGYITSYTETSTLANVTARGASTATRTTFVELGVSKAGSDTVAVGPWFRYTNVAEDRQILTQLNASNGLTWWGYNGSAWVKRMSLDQGSDTVLTLSATGNNPRIKFEQAGVINRGATSHEMYIGEDADTGGFNIRGSGLVSIQGSIQLAASRSISLKQNTVTLSALQPSGFGYDPTGYSVVIVGPTGLNFKSLAFGVDVSGNPSGAFNGNGREYVWRNYGEFITPNAANNGYNTFLSWNSSGNLSAKALYVNGIRIVDNQIQSGFESDSEDADVWINYTGYNAGTTRFRDFRVGNGKATQIMFVDGSTGTTAFSYRVTVANNQAGAATISTVNANSADDAGVSNLNFDGNRLRLGVLPSDGAYGCIASSGAANTGLAFVTHNGSGWGERVRIAPNGNVGIGATTTSAQGLTIYQTGSDQRILLELNRPNNSGLQTALQFTVGNSIMVGQIQHEYAASNQNHMSFSLRSPGGSNFVSLWLKNDGNIGMGTNNPYTRLDVRGSIGMGGGATYPLNARLVKQGSTSVTFTATLGTIGAWRPGHIMIKVSGGQNGLQEYWAAWFFVRIIAYVGSSVICTVVDSGGDTGSVSFSSTSDSGNSPQTATFTLTDSGGTTNTMIADIDLTYNEGIVSLT